MMQRKKQKVLMTLMLKMIYVYYYYYFHLVVHLDRIVVDLVVFVVLMIDFWKKI